MDYLRRTRARRARRKAEKKARIQQAMVKKVQDAVQHRIDKLGISRELAVYLVALETRVEALEKRPPRTEYRYIQWPHRWAYSPNLAG